MTWREVLGIVGKGLWASLKAGAYFRVSFILKVLSGLVRAATVLVFWRAVLQRAPSFVGWDETSILVFLGCSELFFGLQLALVSIAGRFWVYIRTGYLDVYLTRPVDARLLVAVANFDVPLAVRSVPPSLVYFGLAAANGWQPGAGDLLVALAFIVAGALLLGLIQLCFSLTSFWLGPTEPLDEFVNSLYEFGHYPVDTLSGWVRVLVAWCLGLGYVATVPARCAARGVTALGLHTVCALAVGLAGLVMVWGGLSQLLWVRGRERYEGFGG